MSDGFWPVVLIIVFIVAWVLAKVVANVRKSEQQWREADGSSTYLIEFRQSIVY